METQKVVSLIPAKTAKIRLSVYGKLRPLIDPAARLQIWEKARGMWKNKKPDPIKVLGEMRKEW